MVDILLVSNILENRLSTLTILCELMLIYSSIYQYSVFLMIFGEIQDTSHLKTSHIVIINS